jgi:hypothetical protein
MKVSDLIKMLQEIPEDSEITLYNNQYAGGLYDDIEAEPILFLDSNLNLIICDYYTEDDARCFYGDLFTVDELTAVKE